MTNGQNVAEKYLFDGWTFLALRRELYSSKGDRVHLTTLECDLLTIFCQNPRSALSRSCLIDMTGFAPATDRTVDVAILRLRRKLGADAGLIKTIRHRGYYFCPDVRMFA